MLLGMLLHRTAHCVENVAHCVGTAAARITFRAKLFLKSKTFILSGRNGSPRVLFFLQFDIELKSWRHGGHLCNHGVKT